MESAGKCSKRNRPVKQFHKKYNQGLIRALSTLRMLTGSTLDILYQVPSAMRPAEPGDVLDYADGPSRNCPGLDGKLRSFSLQGTPNMPQNAKMEAMKGTATQE